MVRNFHFIEYVNVSYWTFWSWAWFYFLLKNHWSCSLDCIGLRYPALGSLVAFNEINILCLFSKTYPISYPISPQVLIYALYFLGWFYHGCPHIYIYAFLIFVYSFPFKTVLSVLFYPSFRNYLKFQLQNKMLPQLSSPHCCFQSSNDVYLVHSW